MMQKVYSPLSPGPATVLVVGGEDFCPATGVGVIASSPWRDETTTACCDDDDAGGIVVVVVEGKISAPLELIMQHSLVC